MKLKVIGALVAVVVGAGLLFFKQPTLETRLARIEEELDAKLKAREVQIDPGELLDIIYNNNIGLRIVDVRDEADFNLFHIIDSQRVTMDQVRDPGWAKDLPGETVIILVSNDEKRATRAWKLLSAEKVPNLYILEGGINFWLDVFGDEQQEGVRTREVLPHPDGDDTLRHTFDAALGSQHPASDPDPSRAEERTYTKKVKSIGRVVSKRGGCG